MNIKTTKFDFTAEHIGYYLGLPVDIEVDYWGESSDEKVLSWFLNLQVSKGGYPFIEPIFEYINITLHWSVDKDDLSDDQLVRLKLNHDVTETRNSLEGSIHIYTIREKDKRWQISFDINLNENSYCAHIDFLENKIEII